MFRPFIPCLIGAAVILLPACHKDTTPAFTFETAPLTRGDLKQYATASGSLGAVISVDVGSRVSGKISALKVDFNSPVKKGDLVAQIDPSIYKAALRQAEGELASAEATAKLKRQNLARKEILLPKQAATQLDLELAVAELAQAEANVTIRQAAMEKSQADLGFCNITSPVDGIVISRKIELDQTVAAAMTTPILFTIAQDITKMRITASVSEADIGMVRTGQPVDFSVEAFPDETFHGVVSQVRKAPVITTTVVTYESIIDVDNPEQKLFPGMTADVSILVAERKGILRIPDTALRFTPPEGVKYEEKAPAKLTGNQRLAYLLSADKTALRPVVVRVGISDNLETELLEGLPEDAIVVTASTVVAKKGPFGGGPPAPKK